MSGTTTPTTLAAVIDEIAGLLAPDQGEMLTDEGRRLFGLACRAQSLASSVGGEAVVGGDYGCASVPAVDGGGVSPSVLDGLILDQLRGHPRDRTYAMANGIRMQTGVRYPTSLILRRLRSMEKAGKVRCLGFHGNMYEWALAEGHA